MATFTKLDQLDDHPKYKSLLKAALAKVRQTPLPFFYFEKHKFGDKVFPLVLADADPALVNEVKKKAGNPTARGKCHLNEGSELVFEPENGRLDRAKLKRYLATFPGVQHVWAGSGEGGEEETEDATHAAAPPKLAERTVPSQGAGAVPQRAPAGNAPTAGEITAAFNRLAPAAKQAILDHPDQKVRISEAMVAVQGLIKAGALDEAQKSLGKAVALIEALKTVKKEGAGGAGNGAMAVWQSARNQAIAALKQLEAKIRAMEDPESDAAIILVKAIQANLTANPATLQQAAELERYLKTDSAVADAEAPNGFGIAIDIRRPLLEALGKLKPQLRA